MRVSIGDNLMVFGIGKKKKELELPPLDMPMEQMEPTASRRTPTDNVIQMRQQGFNDNQIIQSLQRDGYESYQIFDAMNQADIKGNIAPAPSFASGGFMQAQQPVMQQQMPLPPMQEIRPDYGAEKERIEEVAEAIIDEKWSELTKNINKIVEWKERTEREMGTIRQSINDLKDNFDKLHQAVIAKIGEYDQNIMDVGTEIKAMEKVFQKILPTFTENVNKLSRMAQDVKEDNSNIRKKPK